MGVSHSGSQQRRNKLQKMLIMRGDGGGGIGRSEELEASPHSRQGKALGKGVTDGRLQRPSIRVGGGGGDG